MTTTLATPPAATTTPPTPAALAPAPAPAGPLTAPSRAPLSSPTAADCSMCNGNGGSWVTTDGRTPGKSYREWVPCSGCQGTGKV
ncbi:hypothetical protein SAMN05421803_14129 [Nocardiopsis flavescens]|uniref:Uncharacterized protein n=1 Tax=Nocardiopsis flavescens TaxID=758803 RepID=A0A1M6WAL9_9ACTN|nr:hypothetical protein [Nocardiopsis flavescens]SHK90546.1 hypothetical protein SAMN05421803_14129 [Nocardiopsis flavescens]